jgi:hypothetical protein
MKVAVWAAELARTFWSHVGAEEPFPRTLRRGISAMPLTLETMSPLTVARVRRWLESNGVAEGIGVADRPLRGCLTAYGGHGIIFLDAGDPEDERRFTLAHEVAHFLRDYWRPRKLALEVLGTAALEVLDGKRSPTPGERLGALMGDVPLSFHVHLMDRDDRRRPVDSKRAEAEACADCLAWELLAPAEHVHANRPANETRSSLEKRLAGVYGLPAAQAHQYAGQLLGPPLRVELWLEALRTTLTARS